MHSATICLHPRLSVGSVKLSNPLWLKYSEAFSKKKESALIRPIRVIPDASSDAKESAML